jgi:predicted ATP-dependent endonuclease of OLD family
MKLKEISIYNLRSIKKLEHTNVANGFDVFIGQNDSGKSTILYALKNFFDVKEGNFNFENIDSSENDLCHKAVSHNSDDGNEIVSDSEIGVLCEFSFSDDEAVPERSELADYIESNSLLILKRVNKNKIYNKKQFQYFVLGKLYVGDASFSKLGETDEKGLIELMKEYPDSERYLENINKAGKPENVERRKALNKFAEENIDFIYNFVEFDFKKEIDELWPSFDLVDSSNNADGSNKIIDGIFNEISKKIIDVYKNENEEYRLLLNKIENEFSNIADKICEHAKSHYIKSLESIKASPNVTIKATKDLLIKRVGQSEHSHFNCQGDGTKRRLMVSILQCGKILKEIGIGGAGEKKESEYDKLKIWAFDEPELHLHPGAQRDLFLSLKAFQSEGYQMMCSTHSTIFVDNLSIDSNHLLDLDTELFTIEIKKEFDKQDAIKGNLGVMNSDIFFSNAFIIVEGETEKEALPILFEHLYKNTLDYYGVKIICSNGCDKSYDKMKHLVENFNNCIGLLDKDVKEAMPDFKKWEQDGLLRYVGEICDFEDAFSDKVWIGLLKENFSIDGFVWDEQAMSNIRKEISKDNCNKKMLKMVESKYRSKYMELNDDNTDFDKSFSKPDVGKKLAHKSIELNIIPQEIVDLFSDVYTKLLKAR